MACGDGGEKERARWKENEEGKSYRRIERNNVN